MAWKSSCSSGTMTKRITFQSMITTQNEYGEPVSGWTDAGTVWASIEPLSGRDFFQAQAVQSEITHKIITRWSGARPEMRIKYGTRYFDIESVINEKERGAKYIIMAKEVV